MNVLGRALERRAPSWLRRWAIEQLFKATADAFGRPVPPSMHISGVDRGSSDASRLAQYARFTREGAEQALAQGSGLSELASRMRANAYALGLRVRKWLGVASIDDAVRAARVLYRLIDIDITAAPGVSALRVHRCSFSQIYTPDVCRVMSALDSGLVGGLMGGGSLNFSARLTEGHDCCEALITTVVNQE